MKEGYYHNIGEELRQDFQCAEREVNTKHNNENSASHTKSLVEGIVI